LNRRTHLFVPLMTLIFCAVARAAGEESEVFPAPPITEESHSLSIDQYVAGGGLTAGFELVLARPQWESSPALTSLQADALGSEWSSDTELDYDFALAPRVWLQCARADGIGIRAQYWQFNARDCTARGGKRP
jgi:hypothetical protein